MFSSLRPNSMSLSECRRPPEHLAHLCEPLHLRLCQRTSTRRCCRRQLPVSKANPTTEIATVGPLARHDDEQSTAVATGKSKFPFKTTLTAFSSGHPFQPWYCSTSSSDSEDDVFYINKLLVATSLNRVSRFAFSNGGKTCQLHSLRGCRMSRPFGTEAQLNFVPIFCFRNIPLAKCDLQKASHNRVKVRATIQAHSNPTFSVVLTIVLGYNAVHRHFFHDTFPAGFKIFT